MKSMAKTFIRISTGMLSLLVSLLMLAVPAPLLSLIPFLLGMMLLSPDITHFDRLLKKIQNRFPRTGIHIRKLERGILHFFL